MDIRKRWQWSLWILFLMMAIDERNFTYLFYLPALIIYLNNRAQKVQKNKVINRFITIIYHQYPQHHHRMIVFPTSIPPPNTNNHPDQPRRLTNSHNNLHLFHPSLSSLRKKKSSRLRFSQHLLPPSNNQNSSSLFGLFIHHSLSNIKADHAAPRQSADMYCPKAKLTSKLSSVRKFSSKSHLTLKHSSPYFLINSFEAKKLKIQNRCAVSASREELSRKPRQLGSELKSTFISVGLSKGPTKKKKRYEVETNFVKQRANRLSRKAKQMTIDDRFSEVRLAPWPREELYEEIF